MLQGRQNLVECEPFPDYAGREHQDLLDGKVEEARRLGSGGPCIELAAEACRSVGGAGIDHDCLRLRELEMLLGDDDRGRLHAVRGEHRRAGCRSERAHDREVGRVPA